MPTPSRNSTAGRVFNDLRNAGRQQQRGTDELLVAYALERWLYRVSVSSYRDQFILKGGLLLAAFGARRPTRDADLLGRMDNDVEPLVERVGEIAGIGVDDGLEFDTDQIRAAVIREDDLYSGLRITMPATLGKARIKLALDVNFGDPVTPGAVRISYPTVLESHNFEILAYPIETVLAEKVTTAVNLGEINTRERDWADIWRLTGGHDLDGGTLSEALRRTAQYRGIPLSPLSQRIGSLVDSRGGNYRTWRRRQGPEADSYPNDFETLLGGVLRFADPLLSGKAANSRWISRSRTWKEKA
ncbi:nucleotidyl transferase AbiEii/AbiGii toxin family protein [Natronoglycomyces albus]|uniref:Nucleotidyl transferase AbiEii/AbiGii toxin family protein n=1 Tax=Natronoglycomyces albus TaxID=2811108 RepID=A0A895XR82_9ACTN|nr:nucleotidyl transferase AbiEii/AbiGii toxin family protein [Natronoglycomyces albus]QSB06033.1 nucleotidyl transferase AbiEii/AbiGii toxin family protein [Natronoglycomyces albus]